MRILGLSAYYHDSAAALLIDGRPVAAAQEERFTRRKHDAGFPAHAIGYCLDEAGLTLRDIDHVCFFEKPLIKFERLLETYLANAPRGFGSFRTAMPVWLKEKLFQKINLAKALTAASDGVLDEKAATAKLLFAEHHQSHAASAYYPSPFDEAVVLTMDGVGEWATTSVAIGRGDTLTPVREIQWPHSLGLLYSAFTYYTGFKVNAGEYKIMGLAPYGRPLYAQTIMNELMDLKADGSFWLDQRYFNYATGLTMTNRRFDKLFGGPPRDPDAPLTQREMDLAASVQAVTEEVMLRITRDLAATYAIPNLCMAGGVALNCVANGKILRDGAFKNVWVQPAAGDAGGALGAAYAAHAVHVGGARAPLTSPATTLSDALPADAMAGSYLGPQFAQGEIEQRLSVSGARFEVASKDALINRTVAALERGDAVGWFQGRMEWGPRALGNRSILANPALNTMKDTLNARIKRRE
ncbi:MAG: carbamoyltransferase N-terminal domain-containing protein, partial [Pseudomonadota bacterium]